MKNIKELEEKKVGKLMIQYFFPAFIGVFANALYNIVDRIFIGQGVGPEALSGISVVFPIMLIMMGFSMLIGIGSGVCVSINLGKKRFDVAEQTLGTSFLLMIIVSLIVMVITYWLKVPILRSFGSTDEIFQYANDYLNIILGGMMFMIIGSSMNNIIRSEGNAKIAMVSMLISASSNIFLDWAFIYKLQMGVKGAAYATIISMFILAVWVIVHFRSRRSIIKLKLKNIKLNLPITWQVLAIGMAPFSMQIANSFVQGLLNKTLITYGGDLAVGAMGIINSTTTLFVMSIVALNMASQPIIGFNYGAKSSERVKETLQLGIKYATIIAVSAFIFVEAFPNLIVKLFNSDSQELYEITTNGLRLVVLALPIVGFQIIASNFFQAIGKAKLAMFATLFRQVIGLIPLLYILPNFLGINGVWYSYPISDVLSAIFVTYFFVKEYKKLNYL